MIEVDQTLPASGSKWAFDADVTKVFDDMLARSIPGHDEMRRLVFNIGRHFVEPATDILDLGCSRGAALRPFVNLYGAGVRHVGLEVAPAMLDAARQEFSLTRKVAIVDIREHDLRNGLPSDVRPSLTLAILTLQFVPLEHRQRVVADVFRQTCPGGAMIVIEKVLGDDAATQKLLVAEYHGQKIQNGYTSAQVRAKAQSLQGVLVPLTTGANESMLRAEGFRVSRFWQHLNFAGWIAVKPGVV